jgi:outer membrane lipoprotein LolB
MRADSMRCGVAGLACLLLLAGCATQKVSREPMAADAQLQFVSALPGFRLDGRTSVQAGEEGFQASVSWQQRSAETRVKLSGPLGTGGLTVTYAPGSLRVTNSRGQGLRDAEAESAVRAELGFVPPFDALRYWVLGMPAPGEAPEAQQLDEAGRVNEMTQQQWRIRYDRWMNVATPAGAARLPQRVTVTRADLRLRLFVDRWNLKAR